MSNRVEVIEAASIAAEKGSSPADRKKRVAAYCRVSTGFEDQLNSYESQRSYYTDLIRKNPEWELAGIYADEAVTGTKVSARNEFQKMIASALAGEIDLILCKSISRFARNTVDTLTYVRKLKDHRVEVFFEEENIHTLSMDGELLLTVLSSVAQQEVENISAHVRTGLHHKMAAGKVVGFSGCLGYDYDKNTGKVVLNEQEAGIVRYIFQRYLDGVGAHVIARECNEHGWKTKRGNDFRDSTIQGIIHNEKYTGTLLSGKSHTIDPITKHRVKNNGASRKYLLRDNHPAIISQEEFDAVQKIIELRCGERERDGTGKRMRFSRQYPLSSKLQCGFCGHMLSRRSWHSGTKHQKVIWQCVEATKRGKVNCPSSKGIEEKAIQKAFNELISRIAVNDKEVLDELFRELKKELDISDYEKKIKELQKEIQAEEAERDFLIGLLKDKKITREQYDERFTLASDSIGPKKYELSVYVEIVEKRTQTLESVQAFRESLENEENTLRFDQNLFDAVIEKVIVGGVDEKGEDNPYRLEFIFKSGNFQEVLDAKKYITDNRRKTSGISSLIQPCKDFSNETSDTCRVRVVAMSRRTLKYCDLKRLFRILSLPGSMIYLSSKHW